MSKYIYKINHYIKGSHFKCDAVIHIIAGNLDELIRTLKEHNFTSDGITSIVRLDKLENGDTFG